MDQTWEVARPTGEAVRYGKAGPMTSLLIRHPGAGQTTAATAARTGTRCRTRPLPNNHVTGGRHFDRLSIIDTAGGCAPAAAATVSDKQ